MKNEKRICKSCGKTCRSIGYDRGNGKNHKDWSTRDYHKNAGSN